MSQANQHKIWKLHQTEKPEIVKGLADTLGIDTILAQLLVARGIETFEQAKSFFRPSLSDLHDPFLMKDMNKAVERLETAIENGERILIYGDYDVDGTTAVSLMANFLQTIYPDFDTYIPDRYKEGYGISFQGIDYADDNEMSLIIALDCGIKAIDQINYAKEKGIDFIICDHHNPGAIVPDAYAVLNPKQKDCHYPFKELSGCGVGFKLAQAYAQKHEMDMNSIYPLMDLLAISIGADIVSITDENRVLAHFGLELINSKPRAGIQALIENSGKKPPLTIMDVVFGIGPRINAAGRIEHGKLAVEILSCKDLEKARSLASTIGEHNKHRQELDKNITEEALAQIAENNDINRKSTVVYNENWHKGVIGIVASRLIETHYKPTVVFTKSGNKLAASARSVQGFDLYAALEQCSDILEQFGGHKYAAGMTLKPERYEAFKQRFEEVVARSITDEQLIPEIEVDCELDLNNINPKFHRILKQMEPFGPGNMAPVFASKNLQADARLIGADKNHLKLAIHIDGKKLDSVGFNLSEHHQYINDGQPFHACYHLEENNWNGQCKLQLRLLDLKPSVIEVDK